MRAASAVGAKRLHRLLHPVGRALHQGVGLLVAVAGGGREQKQRIVVAQPGGVAKRVEQHRQAIVADPLQLVARAGIAEMEMAQREELLTGRLGVLDRGRQGRQALGTGGLDLAAGTPVAGGHGCCCGWSQ